MMWDPRKSVLKLSLMATVATLAITPAVAQDAEDDERSDERMVVIGSFIPGADIDALPVTVIDQQQLIDFGDVSTGDLLANIPQVGDLEFVDNNRGTNGARGDVAGVNLRGLGTGNTLTLINGRRMVSHPTNQAINSVPVTFFNVNTIASSSINRVEVLRDGASALYGADATAGVVNFVLQDEYEGTAVSVRYGASDQTSLDEFNISAVTGHSFNNGRTNISLAGTYYNRSPVFHDEYPAFYAQLDRRKLVGKPFRDDTQFDNRSTSSPYGQFTAGALLADGTFDGIAVRQDGSTLTNSSGIFHVQPLEFPGGRAALGNGLFIDDGSLDRDLRYDFNINQIIISELDRYNAAVTFKHEFDSGLELFGDGIYYFSESFQQRAPGPLDDSLAFIIVPKENYYNPFGAVGSPNRLPGIDAPDEGLDVLLTRYRPVEHGPRVINTEQESFRLLGGVRGAYMEWDWESAVMHSEASDRDREGNRISKNLLQLQMALSTPEAFNPFGGPGANNRATLDAVRIETLRSTDAKLTTWDFRAVNGNIWEFWGGPIGMAFGLEWRKEWISENSDPRQDGSIPFTEGAIFDESDVVGVSSTKDFIGERSVFSGYAELQIPVVSEANRMPLVYSLDLQAAARYENFSDFGDVVKPKFSLSWFLVPDFSVRASYAKGFRAPNLVQLNQGDITRRNQGDVDTYRADVTGLPEDTGDTYRVSIRQGNPNLEPENTVTYNAGIVFDADEGLLEGFRFTADYWRFEQDGVIGNFGVQEALDLDALLRRQGSSNPNVVRLDVTDDDIAAFAAWNAANPDDQRTPVGATRVVFDQYVNLDLRTVEGVDISGEYRVPEFGLGEFRFYGAATRLITFDQEGFINGDFVRMNGNPKWRANAGINWRMGPVSAGAFLRYVGDVFDTSATQDSDEPNPGAPFEVEDWYQLNLNAAYNFEEGDYGWLGGTTLRIGVQNVTNELPPIADESDGYLDALYSIRGRLIYGSISKTF